MSGSSPEILISSSRVLAQLASPSSRIWWSGWARWSPRSNRRPPTRDLRIDRRHWTFGFSWSVISVIIYTLPWKFHESKLKRPRRLSEIIRDREIGALIWTKQKATELIAPSEIARVLLTGERAEKRIRLTISKSALLIWSCNYNQRIAHVAGDS